MGDETSEIITDRDLFRYLREERICMIAINLLVEYDDQTLRRDSSSSAYFLTQILVRNNQ